MQKKILKNAVSTYPGGSEKAKWQFFSVQQFCRYCSLAMHNSIVSKRCAPNWTLAWCSALFCFILAAQEVCWVNMRSTVKPHCFPVSIFTSLSNSPTQSYRSLTTKLVFFRLNWGTVLFHQWKLWVQNYNTSRLYIHFSSLQRFIKIRKKVLGFLCSD